MKKIYLFFVFAVAFSLSLTAQEIPKKQSIVISKIGATWCPNCGTAAWDNFSTLVEKHGANAVIISTHPSRSSALHSTESIAYTENLPQAWGQPLFYINQEKYSTNQILSNVDNAVNSVSNESPLANTGLNVQLTGENLRVDATVKFFRATEGEYYLSLLIIEDGVVAPQANRGSSAIHKKLLRGSMTDNAFGQQIVNGSVSADAEYSFNIHKELIGDYQTENVEVAAIIYQKVGDEYQFVNARQVDAQLVTSVNELEEIGVDMTVSPTIIRQNATVAIQLPEALKDVEVSVYNVAGQQVTKIMEGDLAQGVHNFIIEKTQLGASGIYFLKMEKSGNVISKKFIVE